MHVRTKESIQDSDLLLLHKVVLRDFEVVV